MSKIEKNFSKFSNRYSQLNSIQNMVAEELIKSLDDKNLNNILDLGSGIGAVYNEIIKNKIDFNYFLALDFSQDMLDLHPNNQKIKKIKFDFNNSFEKNINFKNIDTIISSSSLQWSSDINFTFNNIFSLKAKKYYFSIFTSNTFKNLHNFIEIDSPIYSENEIIFHINKYLNKKDIYKKKFRLNFQNSYEILKYIQETGVNNRNKNISFYKIKKIIKEFKDNYLEFEVLFIKSKI